MGNVVAAGLVRTAHAHLTGHRASYKQQARGLPTVESTAQYKTIVGFAKSIIIENCYNYVTASFFVENQSISQFRFLG